MNRSHWTSPWTVQCVGLLFCLADAGVRYVFNDSHLTTFPIIEVVCEFFYWKSMQKKCVCLPFIECGEGGKWELEEHSNQLSLCTKTLHCNAVTHIFCFKCHRFDYISSSVCNANTSPSIGYHGQFLCFICVSPRAHLFVMSQSFRWFSLVLILMRLVVFSYFSHASKSMGISDPFLCCY